MSWPEPPPVFFQYRTRMMPPLPTVRFDPTMIAPLAPCAVTRAPEETVRFVVVRKVPAKVPVTVGSDVAVIVARKAATRLFPFGPSPMDITVQFHDDFSGSIADSIPLSFKVLDASSDAVVTHTDAEKLITWQGSWKAGDSATFRYVYDAPDISPDFFTVGPLQFTASDGQSFTEQRVWELANDDDSTQQYIGGNGDGWAVTSGSILQFPSLATTSFTWTDTPDGVLPYVGGNGDGWAVGAGGAVRWTGGAGDLKCSTAGNWDNGIPATTSDVLIASGTGAISWDAGCPSTVHSLTLTNGFTGSRCA